MKAAVIHEYGGPDVLKYEDFADPILQPGEFWYGSPRRALTLSTPSSARGKLRIGVLFSFRAF
jgi:hypothetical protein